jgi:uncharacterized protein
VGGDAGNLSGEMIFSGETMTNMDQVVELPEDFGGRVRLFPLPDLVVFPHAMQPIHIFEPRYCDMLADALATDRLIAMATLRDGVHQAPASHPTIYPTICIGKIISHVETDDGKHNILLIGAQRAKILQELPTNRSFRIADVEVSVDFHPVADSAHCRELKRNVLEAFAAVIPPTATVQHNLHELMTSQMGLGPITDIIAYTLPLGTAAKLALLAEANVSLRAELLVQVLRKFAKGPPADQTSSPSSSQHPSGSAAGGFPPPFSLN